MTTQNGTFGDDTIFTGSGDDTINASAGDDMVSSGAGNDTISGSSGNDTIFGGAGNDSISGGDNNDAIFGGDGDDSVVAGMGDDTVMGGGGDDAIYGGGGNDDIIAQEGNDTVFGGVGDDYVDGGAGEDSISSGAGNDVVYGRDDNDRIDTGEGRDTVFGGHGDDTIDAGRDEDLVFGGLGDDSIDGSDGNDVIYGGDGNDDIDAGRDDDTVYGGAGDDTIFGDGGNDAIAGDDGNDTIDAGRGDDVIAGRAGDDRITTGSGNDSIIFGTGDGHDVVTDFDNVNDTIDLRFDGVTQFSDVQALMTQDGADTLISFSDGSTLRLENMDATNLTASNFSFNEAHICYSAGTLIRTVTGDVRIEDLRIGDLVMTLDHGPQPVRWLRSNDHPLDGVATDGKPVLIAAGALGNGLPVADLIVSPQHRIFAGGHGQLNNLSSTQVFIPAKALTGLRGIRHMRGKRAITWVHFACDRHEVITANGCLSESLLLGSVARAALSKSEHKQALSALGHVSIQQGNLNGPPARPCLTVREVRNRIARLDRRLAKGMQPAGGPKPYAHSGSDKRRTRVDA